MMIPVLAAIVVSAGFEGGVSGGWRTWGRSI